MSEDAIIAVEVIETDFDEKVALQSPYDAKDFINALPWKKTVEEVEEHGSLRAKLEDRGVADGAITAAEDFGFSDDFAAHPTWNPDAFGKDDGAWLIDADTFDEARQFFEFAGFEVENRTDL